MGAQASSGHPGIAHQRDGNLGGSTTRSSRPGGRGADAHGTSVGCRMRAGVRCGPPAPLRVAAGRAQPEPKHRFGRWRRPATGCGAGVLNNPCCRTKKFRSACRRTGQGRCRRTGQGRCRRTGQGRCRRTGQGRCRRTVPYARSAPGNPITRKKCSMEACAVGIHGCKSALIHALDRSISSNMARYSPQSIGQGRGELEFSLSRLPTAQAPSGRTT